MREVHIPLSLLPRVMIQVLWEVLWKSLYKGLFESLSLSAYKYKWRKLNAKLCHDTRIAESRTVWYACILHWFVSCSYFLSILLLPRSTPFCFSLKGNACRFLKQRETFLAEIETATKFGFDRFWKFVPAFCSFAVASGQSISSQCEADLKSYGMHFVLIDWNTSDVVFLSLGYDHCHSLSEFVATWTEEETAFRFLKYILRRYWEMRIESHKNRTYHNTSACLERMWTLDVLVSYGRKFYNIVGYPVSGPQLATANRVFFDKRIACILWSPKFPSWCSERPTANQFPETI